jgi:hypothetical protein
VSLSLEDTITILKNKKEYLHEAFGVIRLGLFGSFVRGEQTPSSDLDVIIEMETEKKNLHSFLQIKRYLEKETARKVDLGFEHSLKPIVREKIKKEIIYV